MEQESSDAKLLGGMNDEPLLPPLLYSYVERFYSIAPDNDDDARLSIYNNGGVDMTHDGQRLRRFGQTSSGVSPSRYIQ
eukprot:4476266-Pyramimonas_sp.AAC.3